VTTSKENNKDKDEDTNKIDYEAVQTEVLLLLKKRIPYASPEEVLSIMSSLLTSMICGTADMVKDLKNKYVNKEEMALGLLEVITTSVRHTIKSNYEMEKLV
jgi:hypothetical protein